MKSSRRSARVGWAKSTKPATHASIARWRSKCSPSGHYRGEKGEIIGSVRLQADLSELPTTPPHLTAQGTILGTFQYMAPEQLEGKDADSRTDIFAFGAVLYEAITGKKAFEGKSQASLIAAILDREPPPISAVQPLAPRPFDKLRVDGEPCRTVDWLGAS